MFDCILYNAHPAIKMEFVTVLVSDAEVQKTLCDAVVEVATKSITDHDFFSIGLSGGSLAKVLSHGLKDRKDIEWPKWHVFYCDERHVPFDSDDSTYAVYKRELFDHVPVDPSHLYLIDPSVSVEDAAEDYTAKIRKLYPNDLPSFDLLLLGMGPDGHTCSLFPGHPGLKEDSKLIIPITDSPKPPPSRITMTFPVLNNASNVFVISTGASKADAVKGCLKPDDGKEPLPAGLVKPTNGKLLWILDEGAASLIKSNL
ncbi:6-phosphogluconolactonase-like [Dysidea avara]|uniref:6-phosphogluconolactonase-like n=1 Tax=Dysidea avara TaxID=196820 RepID=UPI003317A105